MVKPLVLRRCAAAAMPLLLGAGAIAAPAVQRQRPQPKLVHLDEAATGYTPVLTGPPGTVTMRSGYVVLAPDSSVGWHSTERYEEVVVVFSGAGQLRFRGGKVLALGPRTVAYTPPATEHNVTNTGPGPLRYLYVVSRAR
jgi:quercetin dioxygenase-like cupin family protein